MAAKKLCPRTLPDNPNGWRVLPGDVDLRDPKALDRHMPPGGWLRKSKRLEKAKAPK